MVSQQSTKDQITDTNIPKQVMIVDTGHNLIKGLRKGTPNQVDCYPHALRRLTQAEFKEAIDRHGKDIPREYVLVNGDPYAYGSAALNYVGLTRVTGPNRFTSDYVGVFSAIMAQRLFKRNATISVFASHPTGDLAYRGMLAKAIIGKSKGEWIVENSEGKVKIQIGYINTFEEAVGGVNNLILNSTGNAYANADLNKGRVLVIDIGGGTTDFQSIENGKITTDVSVSIQKGIQDVETRFDTSFRNASANLDLFRGVRQLPLGLIRDAITSGKWDGGGESLDCSVFVKEAISLLINEVLNVYDNVAKGPSTWRYIVLTGGGAGMLLDYIKPLLRHKQVILACDDVDIIHYANVQGGAKLYQLSLNNGWL